MRGSSVALHGMRAACEGSALSVPWRGDRWAQVSKPVPLNVGTLVSGYSSKGRRCLGPQAQLSGRLSEAWLYRTPVAPKASVDSHSAGQRGADPHSACQARAAVPLCRTTLWRG